MGREGDGSVAAVQVRWSYDQRPIAFETVRRRWCAHVCSSHSIDGLQADGGSLFSNQAGDAGCVTIRSFGGTLRLYAIALTPGWVYTVTSNGEGTNSRVAITFDEPATGRRVDVKIEFGKTDIRSS